jgi:hypothetical protein
LLLSGGAREDEDDWQGVKPRRAIFYPDFKLFELQWRHRIKAPKMPWDTRYEPIPNHSRHYRKLRQTKAPLRNLAGGRGLPAQVFKRFLATVSANDHTQILLDTMIQHDAIRAVGKLAVCKKAS